MSDRTALNAALIIAGFTATTSMTVLMFLFPALTLPRIDHVAFGGSMLLGGPPSPIFGWLWWLGLMMQFAIGTLVLPFVYGVLWAGLRWSFVAKGALLGVALWLFAVLVIFPLKSMGVLLRLEPHAAWVDSWGLVVCLVYGLTLAMIAEPALTAHPRGAERRAGQALGGQRVAAP